MKSIPFILTVGRCGSSFVAQCLERLGLVVDPKKYWNAKANAGMEHAELTNVTTQMMADKEPDFRKVLDKYRDQMAKAIEPLDAAKSPRCTATLAVWTELGAVSRAIFLTRDSVQDIMSSRDASGCGMLGNAGQLLAYHGNILMTLERCRIPYTVHVFPRFITEEQDQRKLAFALRLATWKPEDECLSVIRELARPELVTMPPNAQKQPCRMT